MRHEDKKRRILRSCHESQTGELLKYEAYLPFVHVVYVNDSVYVSDAGGYLGRNKTIEKICSRFYWGRNMHKEIHDHIRSCERCQRNNDIFHKPHSTPSHSSPRRSLAAGTTHHHWVLLIFFILQIGIDIVTMPTSNKGNKYIITCMDYFSKWPEAVPSKDKSATSVAIFIFVTICR